MNTGQLKYKEKSKMGSNYLYNETPYPQVYMSLETKNRLDLLIQLTNTEISGLGLARQIGNNIVVEEIILFKQIVTSAKTAIDKDMLAEYITNLMEIDADLSLVKLWWHSHCKGSVFWSKQDKDTIELLGDNTDWYLSIVGNQEGNYLCRLDLFKPFRIEIPMELKILQPVASSEEVKRIKKEISNLVTIAPPKSIPTGVIYPITSFYGDYPIVPQIQTEGDD